MFVEAVFKSSFGFTYVLFGALVLELQSVLTGLGRRHPSSTNHEESRDLEKKAKTQKL